MHRSDHTLATIYCETDLHTIERIAMRSGLTARAARAADVFHVAESDRSCEPEVTPELLGVFRNQLDIAAALGKIPNWKIVAG